MALECDTNECVLAELELQQEKASVDCSDEIPGLNPHSCEFWNWVVKNPNIKHSL